jgi:serine/threonine protein kinase
VGQYALTRLAKSRASATPCVVKSLPLRDVGDAKVIELFEREARVLERLDHPRIPRFVELVREETGEGTVLHLVQEYVDGEDLARAIARGARFDEPEAKRVALELLSIVEHLHSLSPPLIHRDIKPGNVILAPGGEVWLVDFGGVRDKLMLDVAEEAHGFTIVGTYGYMPYEQFEGKALPASDLYAIGVTLLFILSHREPADFERRGMKIDFEGAINVSPTFAKVIGKLVEPGLEERYATAAEVRRDLERGDAPKSRASRVALAALAAAAVVAGIMIVRPRATMTETQVSPVSRPAVAAPAPAEKTSSPFAVPDTGLHEVEQLPGSLPEPSAPVSLRGTVTYDGRPITQLTRVSPQFWLRNESTGKVATARATYQNGAFTIHGLAPGPYGINIRFDAVAGNPIAYPGDFYAWRQFDVPESGAAELSVDVVRLIHLVSPQDNGAVLDGWGEACEGRRPAFRRAVTFAWEPLEQGADYHWQVTRVDCSFTSQVPAAAGKTTSTSVRLELEPNRPDEFYMFNLSATRGERRIGSIMTYGSFGHGWDYRFVVAGW